MTNPKLADELTATIRKALDAGYRMDPAQEYQDALDALAALTARSDGWWGGVETFATINQWCDDTFGLATVPQIIDRAKEEFNELEEHGAYHAIEAADVVICLCRIPGFAEALQRKMAINRARKWRLVGNGTGYHIPDNLTPPESTP